MKHLKKIAVILPVLLVSLLFLRMHYFQQYQHATGKKFFALIVTVLVFYVWVLAGAIRRRQDSFFDILLQSSFYVYIFSVLTLTGYFIFFNQVAAHDWWHTTMQRIKTKDGINFQAFIFMKGHRLLHFEVVGNFIMLMPLGIYLPLMYRGIKNFFSITFAAMMVSVSIELMQLATNYRITDIDDVILNTCGASAGFLLYLIVHALLIKPFYNSQQTRLYNQH